MKVYENNQQIINCKQKETAIKSISMLIGYNTETV